MNSWSQPFESADAPRTVEVPRLCEVSMLQRLARLMYRRRRWVLGGWILLLVATFALSNALSGAFKTEFRLPGTESQQAFDLLAKSSFRNKQVQAQIVFAANQGVKDPAVQQAMEGLFGDVEQKVANVD